MLHPTVWCRVRYYGMVTCTSCTYHTLQHDTFLLLTLTLALCSLPWGKASREVTDRIKAIKTRIMAVTDGRKSLLTARHRPPFRGVSVSCLFFFILGFFSALFCYTVSMTTSTSFALQSASVHVQLEKNTPSVLKKTAFPDAEVAVGQTTVGVMKNDNDETAAAKGTLHFPSHCLPWPGEDPVVEGGYIGYHLFLLIYKAAQESIQSETKPRFLCLWDLQPEAAPDQMDVADYLMSKCQSVWVLKGVDVEVDALKSTSPALNVWSSTDTEAFWNTLKQEVQDVDWILFVPDGFYVIFELLEAQLRSLSPSRPIAVPAGILSEPNSGKPAARTPEVLCPGWVYSSSAIRQVSDIIPRQTIQESLFESLHKERFTCPKTNSKGEVDVQWTFVNTTSYTQPAHWLRLHSAIHGTCNQYWNSPLGAKNEKGEWGYVHDPTVLRKNPPPFDDYKSNCQAEGEWYDKTRKALAKVEISSEHPRAKKIFCMVYTHSNRHDQLRSIAETWGPKCDGFMAASNLTDPSIGAVNLWHEGPEMYGNMWLKVRSMVCSLGR